ncbi:MAG: DUF58 domain-containing protein [Planctomycetes bacterium]|nr:DUF58 domain-containing protein [Planctomycetota bacterium]
MSQGLLDPAFLARLEKLEILARKVVAGEMRGDHQSRRRGSGSLFRDHKNYSQGDDLRFLDWNVYSRLGELLVKQFEAEENLDLLLVLDASGSMDYGQANKFEFARRLVAALAFIALNRFAKVDLVILPRAAGTGGSFFGRGQLFPLLQRLQAVRPGAAVALDEDLPPLVGRRHGRGLALLVSDFFAEQGYRRALDYLRHRGLTVGLVHVLDRAEFAPELAGRLRLEDLETGRSLKREISPQLLEAYRQEVERWCRGVERAAVEREMAYARLDSAQGLEQAISLLLGKGGMLR